MAITEILFYLVLPVAAFIYFYLNKKFSYFEDRNIPYLKPVKWPLGNFADIGTKYHSFELLIKSYQELKRKDVFYGLYNSIQPVYVVSDPELARNVLVKDFSYFINRGQFINEEEEPLTNHLVASENEYWRFLRTKLSPAFTSGKIKTMYPTIVGKGDNLVQAIIRDGSGGKTIDAKNYTSRFTCDVITSVAFGMEANTLNNENERLISFFNELFGDGEQSTGFLRFFLISAFPNLAKKLKLRLLSKDISDFFMGVVGDNIKYREDSKDERKDFLNMLIQLKNKGSIDGEFSTDVRKLTKEQIIAQAFVFFFAGTDTTSTVIAFALAELSNNQEVQQKLRNEIIEKAKELNGEISYEALNEMKYLQKVVDETLRMYTPVFAEIRFSNKEYPVPNSTHVIPKGSAVWVNAIGIHYDEKYYPNPFKFDPERFSPEEISKRPNNVYMPFGDGPRNCIGMRIGLLNVKLGLAYIIKNFIVTPDPSLTFPIKMNPKKPLMEPVGGFQLKFQKV